MKDKPKRTIEDVLDLETGEEVHASDFFNKPESEIFEARKNQERAIQGKEVQNKLVCYYCKQIIKIKGKPIGEGSKILHFSHFKDTSDCHIKTNGKYTKEEVQRIKYNGAKESLMHISLKTFIAHALKENEITDKGAKEIKVEEVFKDVSISKEWKKPDVQCIYTDKKLVFEIQLSTTFLSVIVQREEFYRAHKTFILWVFRNFDLQEDLQKFTQKDIIYSNNRNAFVLTDHAKALSDEREDLIFLCHYQVPKIQNKEIAFNWESKYISLSELTFDANTYKVYYFDSDKEFIKLSNKLKIELECEKVEVQRLIKERRHQTVREELGLVVKLLSDFRKTDIERLELASELSYLDDEDYEILSILLQENFCTDEPLWHLILNNPKSKFSNYILKHPKIELEINKEVGSLSAFQYITSIDLEVWRVGKIFHHFVLKGYDFSIHKDEAWIKDRVKKYKELNKEELEKIVILKYVWQLKSPSLIARLLEIIPIVLSLVSFKLTKVLGSDFKNLISVANHFIRYRTEFVELLFKALENKDTEGVLKIESFKNAKEKYHQNPIKQNKNYDDIFATILPELVSDKK